MKRDEIQYQYLANLYREIYEDRMQGKLQKDSLPEDVGHTVQQMLTSAGCPSLVSDDIFPAMLNQCSLLIKSLHHWVIMPLGRCI